jgi:hypothetical protein
MIAGDVLIQRKQDDFSWMDDAALPELAGDADLGMIVDIGRFDLLMAGVWVERLLMVSQEWQMLRLSWISPADGRHFFMDQQGITVAVCSPRAVTMLIDSGQMRVIEPLQLQLSG